ncbi:MAG: hypothetical protein LBB53_05850 [Prevotellaceae bacterium]|jgi:hypothetical protein|nr:hypothetical protein [Prevotellaceae bacterium]
MKDVLLIIIGVFVIAIAGFIAHWLVNYREGNKITAELIRHLGKNEKVIDKLLETEQKPSVVYLKNLKIDENSIIFSGNYFLRLRKASEIEHCRVKLRNLTNWLEEAIRFHQSVNYDFEKMRTLLTEIKDRNNRLKNRLTKIYPKVKIENKEWNYQIIPDLF